jgi:hypothetical protein
MRCLKCPNDAVEGKALCQECLTAHERRLAEEDSEDWIKQVLNKSRQGMRQHDREMLHEQEKKRAFKIACAVLLGAGFSIGIVLLFLRMEARPPSSSSSGRQTPLKVVAPPVNPAGEGGGLAVSTGEAATGSGAVTVDGVNSEALGGSQAVAGGGNNEAGTEGAVPDNENKSGASAVPNGTQENKDSAFTESSNESTERAADVSNISDSGQLVGAGSTGEDAPLAQAAASDSAAIPTISPTITPTITPTMTPTLTPTVINSIAP